MTGRSIPRAYAHQVAGTPGGADSTERSQMDYCSSCRRNLNGALVCPGCGDYAPDIAPPAQHHRGAAAADATAWDPWQPAEAPAPGVRRGAHRGAAAADGDAAAEAVTDTPGAASSADSKSGAATGQGRAARRRQLARWKKHRRRAAAATAFALAGGALTVALLPNKPSTDQTHAAAAPKDPETENTARTSPSKTPAEQPDERASQHHGMRPPVRADRQRHTTDAAPAATHRQATTNQQPETAAPAHTLAAPSTAPSAGSHTAHAPAQRTPADSADTADTTAPAKTAPASSQDSGSGTSPAQSGPAAPSAEPTSPANLCLLGVVCVG
ncbi:SCO2400 family protein [Streptomyces chattanoogensis]|nr:hypothetical protein [Streptomyces chattanoogensis]